MRQAGSKIWYMKCYFSSLALLWSLAMAGTFYLQIHEDDQQALASARIEAAALVQRDLLYLQWSSRQGGLYVPLSAENQPNPRLDFLAEREAHTATGTPLTLVNPANLVRTIYRLSAERDGSGGHVTSTRPLNPENAPDAWEAMALEELRNGATEVTRVEQRQGEDFLQLMRSLPLDPSCHKCHPAAADSGPALQAGVSLSVPLAPLRAAMTTHEEAVVMRFSILWAQGLAALALGHLILRRQMLLTLHSEERRSVAEESVNFLISHDSLTKLPNRQLFDDRVQLALAQAARLEQKVAVIQFGLDNFKQINGSFGHAVGDRLLQDVSRRLTACLRPDDSVARLGDDRFLFLLPGLRRAEDAAMVLEKVRRSLDQALEINGREIFISASAGIALFPEDGRDSGMLVRNAESALNRAKDLGRSTFQYYTPAMNARAVEQVALDSGLRRALQLEQLEVYYQPQVEADSGRVIGAEALLRWHHPELGMVSPLDFIPLAEDSGMILAIGRWVLETACRQAVSWHAESGRLLTVAVNLSPRQFEQPDLVEMIEDVLERTGLAPQELEIEVTEGVLIRNFDGAIENLTDLKTRGIKVAIDDFGTGYSSLSYLMKFPIDRLKIDRSFIAGLEADVGNRVIVSSIVDMTDRMGIELLAEGVETAAQKEILLANRCRFMQGYLFGKAMPAAEFTAFLSRNTAAGGAAEAPFTADSPG
jgi:diguanylate cyclase (GGDEF)-like protein